jgi:hypothetical protein
MATKKVKKAEKPTVKDKEIKAKPTGYRFKTKDNPKLEKKDGTLNKKGKELYFARPTKKEVDKFKKNPYPDGSYDDDVKQIYHEKRADRKHSDDNLKKKFEEGGKAEEVIVEAPIVELTIEEMTTALGREPKYPYDFINGKKYIKCFLRPYYALKG